MTLGIMQPYLFPYLGYFQLIQTVDLHIIYDDVTYIKGGWINRNRILGSNGKPQTFTLPVAGASSNQTIDALELDQQKRGYFLKKFLKSLQQNYRKAPYLDETLEVVTRSFEVDNNSLSDLIGTSIKVCADYMSITTEIVSHSRPYQNQELSGQDRVLDFCRQTNASAYINAIGGMELYDKEVFRESGITLHFLKPEINTYQQFSDDHTPYLSVLDVMMFCPKDQISEMLTQFSLI